MGDDATRVNYELLKNEFSSLRRRVTELERSESELRELFETALKAHQEELRTVRDHHDRINEQLEKFSEGLDDSH
ncbi:MAG: hypothetical protein UY96_C0003G0054 [Parcubacteria group bacterium GW2011_GWB1_56_8]|nr:MAG: hypothetical protein UY96_C0003G0054 [Parcubacteria group bacterium GW2011_GWB1_56_8]